MASVNDIVNNGEANNRFLIGNALITDFENLIVLRAHTTNTDQYATFKRDGATSGYVPSSGLRFKAIAFVLFNFTASTAAPTVGASNNDVGDLSTVAPTWSSTNAITLAALVAGAGGNPSVVNVSNPIAIESGKYLSFWGGSCSVDAICYGYEYST